MGVPKHVRMGIAAGLLTMARGIAESSAPSGNIVTDQVFSPQPTFGTAHLAAGLTNSLLPGTDWVPPPDRFDWIQLKSGEWLKGSLRAMQDRTLDFDSEELDDLSFDWKDIRQVRSGRLINVLTINGEQMEGPIQVTPRQIEVGGEALQVFPRDWVQSLTLGGSHERNFWTGKGTLGLTLRGGNTEQVEYNAQAHLQRRTPATRLTLDYIGYISSANGVTSANKHQVNSEFDVWLSQRFYLVLPSAEYYKDPFQNLEHRITVGVGIGYDIIDRPNMEWNITTGPAYQDARFESNLPDEPSEKQSGALTFGSRFDYDITPRIELILDYRGQYTSKEVGETTHHAVNTLSIELTRRFDLDISFVWDHISQPKTGEDGVQPDPDDYRLVVGIGLDF